MGELLGAGPRTPTFLRHRHKPSSSDLPQLPTRVHVHTEQNTGIKKESTTAFHPYDTSESSKSFLSCKFSFKLC